MSFHIMDCVRKVAGEYFRTLFLPHSLSLLDVRVVNEVLFSSYPLMSSPLQFDWNVFCEEVSQKEPQSEGNSDGLDIVSPCVRWCRILITAQRVRTYIYILLI